MMKYVLIILVLLTVLVTVVLSIRRYARGRPFRAGRRILAL